MPTSVIGFILRALLPMGMVGLAGHGAVEGESRNLHLDPPHQWAALHRLFPAAK